MVRRRRLWRIATSGAPWSQWRVVWRSTRTTGIVSRCTVLRRMVILVIWRDHIKIFRTSRHRWRILSVRTVLRRWWRTWIRTIVVLLFKGCRVRERNGLVRVRSVFSMVRRRVSISTIGTRTVLHRSWMSSSNCSGSHRMRSPKDVLVLRWTRRRVNYAGLSASLENDFYAFIVIVSVIFFISVIGAGTGKDTIICLGRVDRTGHARRWSNLRSHEIRLVLYTQYFEDSTLLKLSLISMKLL